MVKSVIIAQPSFSSAEMKEGSGLEEGRRWILGGIVDVCGIKYVLDARNEEGNCEEKIYRIAIQLGEYVPKVEAYLDSEIGVRTGA